MQPQQILKPLRASLEDFSQGWGHVSLAEDPFNVFEQLTAGPHGTLIVLHWDGDEPAGQTRQSPFVRNRLEVYVGRNKGLSLDPGDTLVNRDFDGEKPLFELVSDVREHIRSFDYNDQPEVPDTMHERSLSYGGTQSVILPSGLPMAAQKLTFNLITSLPTI